MRKIFLSLILLLPFHVSFSQDSIPYSNELASINYGFGGSSLYDENVMLNRDVGIAMFFGIRLETKKRKMAIMPLVSFRQYNGDIFGPTIDNNMLSVKAACAVDFLLFRTKDETFSIYNQFELGNVWYDNYYLEPSTGYSSSGTIQTNYSHETFFKAQAGSIKTGFKMQYKLVFLTIGYDIIRTTITYEPEILNWMLQTYPDMDRHPTLFFNSTTIHLGVSIPFSRLSRFGGGGNGYRNYGAYN